MRNILKKWATLLIVTILTAGLFSSCKKDEETTTTTYNVEGLWTGTYNVKGDVGIGNQPFTLTIKKDSSVLVETKFFNEYQIAKGTWTLTGDKFTCSYTYIYGAGAGTNTIQSASATFIKNSGTFTNATWVNVNPASGQNGVLVLTKIY